MSKPPGWRNEPARHSLAARGMKTHGRFDHDVPTKYRKKGYEIYRDGVYQGFTESREEAEEHVDEFGGNVVHSLDRKSILYRGRGVSRNIFGLYSINSLRGEQAHNKILQAIQNGTQEDVVNVAREYIDVGAHDTESRERITEYWDGIHPKNPFNYNLWYG